MPKSDKPWITFRSTEEEKAILEQYCYDSRQTKTQVLRQLIRGLQTEKLDVSAVGDELSKAFPDEYPTWGTTLAQKIATLPADRYKKIQARTAELVDEEYNRQHSSGIRTKEEIHDWLQSLSGDSASLKAEADQEVADAKSLRLMAQQMLYIAERLEK